jgi:transposase
MAIRVSISKSKNAKSYYLIEDVVKNGKRTTQIREKLGTHEELLKELNGQDPYEWAKKYAEELNRKEKENEQEKNIIVKYSPTKQIMKNKQNTFNGGYLFLQKIYYELGLHKICDEISEKYKFEYDLNSILSRLLYSRIIYPSSKLSTYKLSKRFFEQPNFDLHHIYRALSVLAEENDFIQATIYENSKKICNRNTKILYYDCTNYYFEIDYEEDDKRYGYGKDHKPNPIVQMGLFMDGSGIPLAFSINRGNANEQTTMVPLEEKILSDFNLAKFIVCTDAGLSSTANRKFNDKGDRAFITTQSVKKLKEHLKNWALKPTGWSLPNDSTEYDISKLDEEEYKDKVFYKDRWIKEDGLEQKLIVTFSFKYRKYQQQKRQVHIEKALSLLETEPQKSNKKRNSDYKRFIKSVNCTESGEIADNEVYYIDEELIANEQKYDGFYAVCTNLDDDASEIAKINHRRWEIEECFRIMKSEFKARPVHLKDKDRILAHFATCFMALILYRILEKRLEEKYTCCEIIQCLRDMNFTDENGYGYKPLLEYFFRISKYPCSLSRCSRLKDVDTLSSNTISSGSSSNEQPISVSSSVRKTFLSFRSIFV